MTALLSRFKLSPPGIKRLNGSWSLLNIHSISGYENFLSQYANNILNLEQTGNINLNNTWNNILSADVAKYL